MLVVFVALHLCVSEATAGGWRGLCVSLVCSTRLGSRPRVHLASWCARSRVLVRARSLSVAVLARASPRPRIPGLCLPPSYRGRVALVFSRPCSLVPAPPPCASAPLCVRRLETGGAAHVAVGDLARALRPVVFALGRGRSRRLQAFSRRVGLPPQAGLIPAMYFQRPPGRTSGARSPSAGVAKMGLAPPRCTSKGHGEGNLRTRS